MEANKPKESFTTTLSFWMNLQPVAVYTNKAWKGSKGLTKSSMVKYQIAKLQGADPQDPDFNKLAEAAVLGLPERPHEVKAWAECLYMNQSTLDVWSMNLPCSPAFSAMRIPICCLDTRMIAAETIQAICGILFWSFDCLNKGTFPTARHDGSPWLKHDAYRKFRAGAALPGKATLIQIRSDWDWNCKYFGAGTWNEKKGNCWLCQATPDNWR